MSTMLALAAGFHPELTGRENIYFNGAIHGPERRGPGGKIDRIIDFSELNDFIDSPVKTYSDGMLMRLGFSIAVETDPDILLIDEVLAVGDAEFQEKCYDRIDAFKRAGQDDCLCNSRSRCREKRRLASNVAERRRGTCRRGNCTSYREIPGQPCARPRSRTRGYHQGIERRWVSVQHSHHTRPQSEPAWDQGNSGLWRRDARGDR